MAVPSAVRRHLHKLIPSAYIEEMVEFCLLEEFPNLHVKADVVIITKRGELVEFKDRQVIRSIFLKSDMLTEKILVFFRKMHQKHNYLIKSGDAVFIVGYNEDNELELVKELKDVTKIKINDANASGAERILVWFFDDVIPLVLTDAFEEETSLPFLEDPSVEAADERFEALLNNKMTEMRLESARNRKQLLEKRKFRQEISHVITEDTRYDVDRIATSEDACLFDKLKIGTVWQRICNGKWVIGIPIQNISSESIDQIELLLKCEDCTVLSYSSAIYLKNMSPPFWINKARGTLEPAAAATVIAIAKAPIFEDCTTVVANTALRYWFNEQLFCLPLPSVEMKAMELITGKMDPILCSEDKFGHCDVLALLVTGLSTLLDVHYLTEPEEQNILPTILKTKLNFSGDLDDDLQGVLRHSVSPLHILHGSVVFISPGDNQNFQSTKISVLTRSNSQLVLFVNLLYDLIPIRSVIVPQGFCVSLKKSTDNNDDEEMDVSLKSDADRRENIKKYGSSLYEQMTTISGYLEACIEKMSETNNKKKTKSDASMSIDITALGEKAYRELWSILKESMVQQNNILSQIL